MADAKISALPSATTPLAGTEVLPVVQGGTTDKVSVANLTAGRAVAAGSLSINGAGTGANLNTKPTTYGFGTAVVPSLVMESNASGGTATNPSSHGAVIWGTVASPMGTINLVQTNPSASSRNYLSISTTANGTYQETFRIADLGDINVPIGNIIPGTAAKGVNFTANTPAAGMTSQLLNWYEEGTWTPTVTAGTGTITSVTSASGKYTRIGRAVSINCTFVITTNGTGASYLIVDGLPFTVSNAVPSTGYNASSALTLTGTFGASSTQFNLFKYDGTYPGASGATYFCSGVYYV